MSYSLGEDGYFRRDGRRFIPFGANWWPASCGVELWQAWPTEEIRHDLDLMAEIGLNCIRFFVRWQDFEIRPGVYDQTRIERLVALVGWCGERGLAAHPALFVGFMSGGLFWPDWKAGRNLFADPVMAERSEAFAARICAALRPVTEHLLAIDHGNELCCLRESSEAPPAAVSTWCARVSAAIRSELPGVPVIAGNEQNQVVNDTGWRLDAQPGCDLLSMHGYPIPAWNPIGFDGMTDPFCQSLLPFYTACARAFAPVLVQEFGTIVTFGARQQDTYLRAILPACWSSGANGFLWWCFRDIRAAVHPYLQCGFEGTLGLVDDTDRVKPGLEYYLAFGRQLTEQPPPTPASDAVGLYWPRTYWPRDEPGNAGNIPSILSRRLLVANHLLRVLGHEVQVVRGDLPLPTQLRTLVVAGAHLRADEAETLTAWVQHGGRLIWHGPDPVNWGGAYVRLLGARPVDYRGTVPARVPLFGQDWTLPYHPRGMRCEVETTAASILASDQDGLPLVIHHQLGAGLVRAALPVVEDAIAAVAEDRHSRDAWAAWYAGMLSES